MKRKALFLTSLLALTACRSAPDSATSGAPSQPALHQLYSFEVDARPVDGNYQKLSVTLDEESATYTASLHTITAGDGSPVQDFTEELGANLECQAEKIAHGKLGKLYCRLDNRPADGFLIELTVTRNEDKLYDVILHKNAYPQIQGMPGFDETTELAYSMKRLN